MALLLKNNAVFLHIPKTGGTWIGALLKELDLVDRTLRSHCEFDRVFWHDRFHHDGKVFRNLVRRRLGWLNPVPPNSFRFCFVREPLSWYVSWWRYMQSMHWRRWGDDRNPYHWSPVAMLNELGSPDFNTFVENVNRKRPGFVTELYGWYVRPGLSFMGRQENLRQDVMRALDLMEVRYDPAVVKSFACRNESPDKIPAPEWDPEVRRKVVRLEYTAYVRYGYAVPEEGECLAESLV